MNYIPNPGYIQSPFKFVYQESDLPIQDVALSEIIQCVLDLDDDRLDLDLDYIEHLIKMDALAYVRQGALYSEIFFKKLYKRTYSNFEPYCKDVLHKSIDSVRNYIKASRVTIELIMAGYEYNSLPHNMSCAVALSEWTGNELVEKWEYVLSNLSGHQRTSARIGKLLYPPRVEEDLNTTIKLPLTVYTALIEVAYKAETSMVKVIESVITVYYKVRNKAEIHRLINWILDLNNLILDC